MTGHFPTGSRAKICLLGPFSLKGPGGIPIALASKKSRALLAILCLSPGMKRSRNWLQSCLWGRFTKHDGQSNLRRELSNLLRFLRASDLSFLEADRDCVWIKGGCVEVDVLLDSPDRNQSETLLEGVDLAGCEEFEDWLREQRSALANHKRFIATNPIALITKPSLLVATVVLDLWNNGSEEGALLPQVFSQTLTTELRSSGYFVVRVQTMGSPEVPTLSQPDVYIKIHARTDHDSTLVILDGTVASSKTVFLSLREEFSAQLGWIARLKKITTFASMAADAVLHSAMRCSDLTTESHAVKKSLFTAINKTFSLNPELVRESHREITRLSEEVKGSVFFAWRAYQANFLLDHAHGYGHNQTRDEMLETSARCLESDPYNGLALSLLAQVHAFNLNDQNAATGLLERARTAGANGAMYFDALALRNFYAGKYDDAETAAEIALSLGYNSIFRYAFKTTLCMIATMKGQFDRAVLFGREAIASQPLSRRLSYPPTLRYLGVALAKTGNDDEAREVLASLGARPEFSRANLVAQAELFPNVAAKQLFKDVVNGL